ncbi:MAG: protein kinase [Gammaproteobacteria bacterium]|nr:protein kinase [Gammaproteobacteria bacterium]
MNDSDRKGPGDGDDPTEFRNGSRTEGDDPTEFRKGGLSDQEDRTELRSGDGANEDVDDSDPTEFRGKDDAADPSKLRQDEGDRTQIRLPPGDDDEPEEDEANRTQLREARTDDAGSDEDEGDRTQMRAAAAGDAGSEEDEDERTQMRVQAVLPPGRSDTPSKPDPSYEEDDQTLFRSPDEPPQIEDEELELTHIRPSSGGGSGELDRTIARGAPPPVAKDSEDATRLRSRGLDDDLPDDEDPTIAGAATPGSPADDDPTVRPGAQLPVGDDDPTVQTLVRGVGAAEDADATVRAATESTAAAGADEDATVRGPATATVTTTAVGDDEPTVQNTGATTGTKAAAKPTAAALGSGTVLKGRFVLEDKLGEGGMGGVYKAVDLVKQEARDRNPHVAVKVLNENFAEHPDAFIALQRESSRTQRLSHPSIASVYDFDRDGQTAYMVMELMQGDPLDKFLKKHKQGVDKERAFAIIKDIASALAYAHAQGLIHSDFKPGNIFLTSSGAAKVFDFGIARAAAAPGEEKAAKRGPVSEDTLGKDDGTDKTLFDAGALGALTPAYAACEMFEGKDPAPQDDVYALGIVGYQLLTGRHPFDRKKAPIAEAQNMVPQRPDGLTRREWNALKHALAFRREDRTPDAQVFLEEFFGVTGTGLKYALITATGMAAVIAGLYFGGVIGPGEAAIEVPREWVELDTRIENARSGVEEQLATPVFSPVWEEFVQRDIRRWEESATPVIVVGTHDSEAAAETVRRQVFEQLGIPLRVQAPERSGAGYRLLAGPFGGSAADRERADILQRLRGFGLNAVEESDAEAIATARDQALGVYLTEIQRLTPDDELPRIPTIRDGDRFVADPSRLESARSQVSNIRDAQEVLNRAIQRYPTRPDVLNELSATLQDMRTRWQDHIDRAIATASSRQAEEDRAELLAQQRSQAELERRRAYEAMRDDRVFPTFAGRCHQPGEIRAALEEFQQLQEADQREALNYAAECASNRVTRSPVEVLQSQGLILAVASHEGLAAVEAPDPCSSRTYIGNGRTSFCVDELAVGGNAPAVVVVPGNSGGIYGIGKYEVSVGEFNAFCEATNCGTPAPGGPRMPATGITADAARRYTEWLSAQTGYTYRLPTEREWLHAADAGGSPLDSNRNCYSNIRGVVRGERLVAVTQGAPNAWGVINHVGNAQEWVMGSSGLLAVGGKHSDPLADCNLQTRATHSGSGDAVTGFRVLREIRP